MPAQSPAAWQPHPQLALSRTTQHTVRACSSFKQKHAAHQGRCSSLGPRHVAAAKRLSDAQLIPVLKAVPGLAGTSRGHSSPTAQHIRNTILAKSRGSTAALHA